MTNSVATYANASIETMGVTETTPLDMMIAREELIAAMQNNFTKPLINPIKPLLEVVSNDPIMSTVADELSSFADRRALANAVWQQKMMIYRNFGRFLPDDEKKLINASKEGLVSIEDRLSAAVYAIDKVKSRKAWKLEQNKLQNASHYGEKVIAKKVITDKGYKWIDATVHELPPQEDRGHSPAYYAIKLPCGKIVNLGAKTEKFNPKLNKYPSVAMQNIAARLNIVMRGGDTAILNILLGAEMLEQTNSHGEKELCYQYLPSYTSIWSGSVWVVYVGWRANPKCTPSSYWLDSNDELTQMPVEGEKPLTLSQLDYKLLCESSDLAVTDENNEVVEFMNEEEEFLTMFPQRETDETFIDFTKYCEDDEEMELFQACSAVTERSEAGITLGDLESSQFVNDYLHKGILRTEKTIRKMKALEEIDDKTLQIIQNLEQHLVRLKRLNTMWNKFVGNSKTNHLVTYWYPNNSNRMMCMSSENHAKMIPAIIAGACNSPSNEIERPIIRELDKMPDMTTTSHEWKNGHPMGTAPSRRYSWSYGLSPKVEAKRQREARKGQVLRSIKAGTLSIELAFSRAFEEALRA